MAATGLFFAVPESLGEFACDQEAAEAVADLLDDRHAELAEGGWVLNSGKSWEAIHRCLTCGTLRHGYDVEHSCVLGSGEFGWDDPAWIVNVLDADEVRDAAEFVRGFGETEFRERYADIDPADYCFAKSAEDFARTWHCFTEVREFYLKASAANRWVVFLADQ